MKLVTKIATIEMLKKYAVYLLNLKSETDLLNISSGIVASSKVLYPNQKKKTPGTVIESHQGKFLKLKIVPTAIIRKPKAV